MNEYSRFYAEPNTDYIKLLHSKYDNLFKEIIMAEWCVKSNGNVESPSGYFSLVEIPDHSGELQEMMEAVNSDWHLGDSEVPDAGWYITQEMNTGVIYVFEHPDQASAEKAYAEADIEFSDWDDSDE